MEEKKETGTSSERNLEQTKPALRTRDQVREGGSEFQGLQKGRQTAEGAKDTRLTFPGEKRKGRHAGGGSE